MMLHAADDHVPHAASNRFIYDVFVIHAAADDAFVSGYLLAKLGLAPERVLQLQTLELGQFVSEEVERGVRSSRATIVVLSSAHIGDPWVGFGQQLAAYASVARGAHGVLLPLLLEDCMHAMHVASLVTLDFRNRAPAVWEAEMARLRAYLDRPAVLEAKLACPYPGMRAFTRNDGDRFFGREAELDSILYRLRHGEREIYIIGPSGSGKSSLVAAGLVPRLARGVAGLPHFHERILRPGERPFERLCAALDSEAGCPGAAIGPLLARHSPATSLLIVVDQLEELFATSSDDQKRDFLAAIRQLRLDPRCTLVFTLRADFYGAFMNSALWTDNDGRISRIDLGPLSREHLRAAIERPARDLGVYFHPELISRLLDDAAPEPGALPLLQETLFQLWGQRRERMLALADYQALGNGTRTGLAFAVAKHADFVLGRLTSAQKVIAFRILLRLVHLGEGRADTRRQQPRAALRSAGEAAVDFDAVLQCLIDHRLVTVTGDDEDSDVRVDLAHEILIDAWSTFAERIRTWRLREQQRRDLEVGAAVWRASDSGSEGLLGPIRLAAAIAWRDESAHDLGHTIDLAAFLKASQLAQADALRREQEQRDERDRLLAESAQFYLETGRQRLLEA
jgi:hypothetical protein